MGYRSGGVRGRTGGTPVVHEQRRRRKAGGFGNGRRKTDRRIRSPHKTSRGTEPAERHSLRFGRSRGISDRVFQPEPALHFAGEFFLQAFRHRAGGGLVASPEASRAARDDTGRTGAFHRRVLDRTARYETPPPV